MEWEVWCPSYVKRSEAQCEWGEGARKVNFEDNHQKDQDRWCKNRNRAVGEKEQSQVTTPRLAERGCLTASSFSLECNRLSLSIQRAGIIRQQEPLLCELHHGAVLGNT